MRKCCGQCQSRVLDFLCLVACVVPLFFLSFAGACRFGVPVRCRYDGKRPRSKMADHKVESRRRPKSQKTVKCLERVPPRLGG